MRLEIQIDRRPSPAAQIARAFSVLCMIVFIPALNEIVLSGHWSINLIGALMGLVIVAAAFRNLMPTVRKFETKEAAADWVRSGEWERDE